MSETGEKVAQATRQRAAVYAHLFLVLRKKLGEAQAVDLMSEAIYNFGREKSTRNYSGEGALRRPRAGRPGVRVSGSGEAAPVRPAGRVAHPRRGGARDVEVPLVDEWRAMGLPDKDVATLCRVAHSVDFGTWEGRWAARSASREPAGRARTSASSA